MARIAIIGAAGVLGSALTYGFEKLGHKVFKHDLRFGTHLSDVLDSETVYLCLPTPESKTEPGRCDTSIVEKTIDDLHALKYTGIIVIKSTVEPGFTDSMIDKHKNPFICMCPEFLKEKQSYLDFMNQDVLIVGTGNEEIYKAVVSHHGRYCKATFMVEPKVAELCKLFNNNFNSTLITFANSFYEICKAAGADYSKVKNIMVQRDHIHDSYLDVNDNFRGFAGPCLLKDAKSLNFLANALGTQVKFFEYILSENDKYPRTVPKGMRPE